MGYDTFFVWSRLLSIYTISSSNTVFPFHWHVYVLLLLLLFLITFTFFSQRYEAVLSAKAFVQLSDCIYIFKVRNAGLCYKIRGGTLGMDFGFWTAHILPLDTEL